MPFVIRYVPDRCKVPEICDNFILENGGMLQEANMCYKAVDDYAHALEFIPDWYKIQKCNKAVDTCPCAIQFVLGCYKTQEMCDKVVDASLLSALVPDWFIMNKIFEKDDVVFSNDNIIFVNEDTDVTFFSDDYMCL